MTGVPLMLLAMHAGSRAIILPPSYLSGLAVQHRLLLICLDQGDTILRCHASSLAYTH